MFAGRACETLEGTHAGAVNEELQPVGRAQRSSRKTSFDGRDPTLDKGKIVRGPPPEEEGAAKMLVMN